MLESSEDAIEHWNEYPIIAQHWVSVFFVRRFLNNHQDLFLERTSCIHIGCHSRKVFIRLQCSYSLFFLSALWTGPFLIAFTLPGPYFPPWNRRYVYYFYYTALPTILTSSQDYIQTALFTVHLCGTFTMAVIVVKRFGRRNEYCRYCQYNDFRTKKPKAELRL